MAFTWEEDIANEAADGIAAHLSGGVGKWYTNVPAEICTFNFTGAFGAAAAGVAEHTNMSVGTNATGSAKTIDSLRVFETGGSVEVGRSQVGNMASSEAVKLTSLVLEDTETVQLSSFEISVGPVTP